MQLPKLLLLLTRLMASISQALPGRSPDSARRAWRRAGIARAVLITILYSQGEVSPGIDSIMSPLVFPSALGRLRRRFLFFLFHATLRKKSRVPGIQKSPERHSLQTGTRDVPDVQTEHCATLSPKTQCENCITGKTIIDLARYAAPRRSPGQTRSP